MNNNYKRDSFYFVKFFFSSSKLFTQRSNHSISYIKPKMNTVIIIQKLNNYQKLTFEYLSFSQWVLHIVRSILQQVHILFFQNIWRIKGSIQVLALLARLGSTGFGRHNSVLILNIIFVLFLHNLFISYRKLISKVVLPSLNHSIC